MAKTQKEVKPTWESTLNSSFPFSIGGQRQQVYIRRKSLINNPLAVTPMETRKFYQY